MAIVHIVMLKFKSTAEATTILDTCNRFLDLKTKAVDINGQPYIQNMTGGKNISTEGLSDGLTHAFTIIFASEDEKNYYIEQDKAHAEFVKHLQTVAEKALVVDYEPLSF